MGITPASEGGPRRTTLRRGTALVLATLATVAAPLLLAAAPASADEQSLTITLTAAAPSGQGQLEFQATIENATTSRLGGIRPEVGGFSGAGASPTFVCPDMWLDAGQSMVCTADYVLMPADVQSGVVELSLTVEGWTREETVVSGSAGMSHRLPPPDLEPPLVRPPTQPEPPTAELPLVPTTTPEADPTLPTLRPADTPLPVATPTDSAPPAADSATGGRAELPVLATTGGPDMLPFALAGIAIVAAGSLTLAATRRSHRA